MKRDPRSAPNKQELAKVSRCNQSIYRDWKDRGISQQEYHDTAVATYTGSATSSYVKGYTVTADYTGTVGKINLDRVRFVAIFEGTPLQPVEVAPAAAFNWAVILAPIAVVALVGAAAGAALVIRRRRESDDGGSEEQVQG